MLFNSLAFAVFLPIVFILYWILPHKYRWALMLVASYYFYMSWNPQYLVLILLTTMISYASALLMEKESGKKKVILSGAAAICFGILFFFKYFNFFSESFVSLLKLFSFQLSPTTLKLILPVGISFYTFQTLSYVIDVYRGEVKAERHFGYYAAFISFFPQLVAGPIERTNNLLPQIKEEHVFNYKQASYGMKLMAWGFFKKLVIADTLSQFVSKVYDTPRSFQGFALVLATVFFTIQIYCDFSGYSDIARGTARLFGIDLMENFKSPYFSQSIKEFWSRWHISLSSWFKDYVYIPMGGSRVSKRRRFFNLITTFLASGLWHGANWTFIAWGAVHGLAQGIENAVAPKLRRQSKGVFRWLRISLVFSFCSLAWVFFVSNSMEDAFYVLSHMLQGISEPLSYLGNGYTEIGLDKYYVLFLGMSIIILAAYDYCTLKGDVIEYISSKKPLLRWSVYVVFMLWILLNLPVSNTSEFIYFQF